MNQLNFFDIFEDKTESKLENKIETSSSYGVDSNLYLNKRVYVFYGNKGYEGYVSNIYNNNNTINVIFNGRSTAFYKDKVFKLNK